MIRFAQRFVLEQEIGAGGMARVFLGRDEVLDRPVAVKILRFGYGDSDIGARFRREGRTAARLSHPNIVQVYDAGEEEFEGRETSYIVMEYVPGGDLKELIDDKGPMPAENLARLGSAVASGLAHAHERGVIHRDIKPHNILLDADGSPKLTDFGIARALDSTTAHATRTGSYLGTALYSSPEQLQGEKVTPKSDVYSLGATLYEAATGRPPFSGSPISVASQHVSKPPPPPAALNAAIGGPIEAVILACLAKDPNERPSAEEVCSRLAELTGETGDTRVYAAPVTQPTRPATAAEPTRVSPRPAPNRRRRRAVLAVLALVALLALIAALALPTLLGGNDQTGQPNPQPNDQQPGNQQPDRQQPDGGQNPEPQPPPETTAAPPPTPPETTAEPTQPGGLTQEAAVQTVQEFYTAAAQGNYDRSSELLSTNYRQSTFSSEAAFQQFDTLERIEFTQGPTAQVSGNTATVAFSTNAYHSYGVEQRSGTATLVNENGEWRIDAINV